jgi:hypothetical protein
MIALLPLNSFSAEFTPKTPKEILQASKSKGPEKVIALLFRSGLWNRVVYPGISSGKKEWIDVAVALEPGADAGGSEELGDALSLALLKRPGVVLPQLKKLWWKGSDTCYFGWDSEFPENMTVREYVNRLERAVKNRSNNVPHDLATSCLSGIAKTRKELDKKNRQ